MKRVFKLALALSAAIMLTPAAAFAETIQSRSVTVRYDDLNLANAAGARTLLNRLERASAKVCGGKPSPRLIGATKRFETCRAGVLSTAIASVNAPTLTALVSNGQFKLSAR